MYMGLFLLAFICFELLATGTDYLLNRHIFDTHEGRQTVILKRNVQHFISLKVKLLTKRFTDLKSVSYSVTFEWK